MMLIPRLPGLRLATHLILHTCMYKRAVSELLIEATARIQTFKNKLVCLIELNLYVPVSNFLSYREVSRIEPVLSRG